MAWNFQETRKTNFSLINIFIYFFKTSWRRLGRRKIGTLKTSSRYLQDMSWRRPQDVLEMNKCLLGRYKCLSMTEFMSDTIKTDSSRECFICHYWHLLRINFRFQPKACDDCNDMTQKPLWPSMILWVLLLEKRTKGITCD